ncbi:hypothetical protein ACJQWK_05940 [Exserohilum turcicum]
MQWVPDPSAREIQQIAGFPPAQWDIFLRITANEARRVWMSDRSIKWRDIGNEERRRILDNINAQLSVKGCPEVDLYVVKWRISLALSNLKTEGMWIYISSGIIDTKAL